MKKMIYLLTIFIFWGQITYASALESQTWSQGLHWKTSLQEEGVGASASKDLTLFVEGKDKTGVQAQTKFQETMQELMTNPWVVDFLLVLGMVSFVLELFRPKFALWGIVSALSFGFFFIGNILAGYASPISIFFFILGVFLLIVEAFIPGFGIPGVLGILAIFLGLMTAMHSVNAGLTSLTIASLFTLATILILIKKGARSPWLDRVTLKVSNNKKSGYNSNPQSSVQIGDLGIALTSLRPSGFISIQGERLDAISEDGFIEKSNPVEVVKVQGSKIIVRRK